METDFFPQVIVSMYFSILLLTLVGLFVVFNFHRAMFSRPEVEDKLCSSLTLRPLDKSAQQHQGESFVLNTKGCDISRYITF